MRNRLVFLVSLGTIYSAIGCVVPAGDSEEATDSDEALGSSEQLLAATGDGLSTCGPAHDESCAAKLPVKISDTKAIQLAKFDITAGRFRQFVEATGGNFHGYIDANEPSWWNGPWRAKLASATPTGVGNFWTDVGGYGHDWTVWLPRSTGDVGYLVGPWNFGVRGGDMALAGANGYSGQSWSGSNTAIDWSMYGPGNAGCVVNDYGARTYWQPNGATGDDQQYAQAELDRKALNCTSFYLLAAFCAWDGGRLPTTAELDAAWGAETYPWGTTAPYYADFNGTPITNGPRDLANYGNSAGAVYMNPPQAGVDGSNRLSIPGDFPKGNGPYGHADLAGLVMAMTGNIVQGTASQGNSNTGATVTVANAPIVTWHRGGSWQGHKVSTSSGYRFIATNKYTATGGRCAYDTGAPAAASFPSGYRAQYFSGTTLSTSKGTRIDPYIAFTSSTFRNPAASSTSTPYSVRWTATLRPRFTETYTFKTVAGDGMRLWVNGRLIINDWTSHAVATRQGTIALTAGQPVAIKVEHYNASGNGTAAKVLWRSTSQLEQVVPAAVLTPN